MLSACGNSSESVNPSLSESSSVAGPGNEAQELAQFTLLSKVSGQGSVSPTKSLVDNGSVLTLSATPNDGWQFDRWSGDLSGTINPTSLTIDADKTVVAIFSQLSTPGSPILNFSDLISGPDTGLDDGLGSGSIVTVWGQNLGATQGTSTISFKDSAGNTFSPEVYYWKNADGLLPGGPANLYASHFLGEVAISIPDAADGLGQIMVTVAGVVSNTLPFTIRSGKIFHVTASGSDSSGVGRFNEPWLTIDHAFNEIDEPGATIYIHDNLLTGDASTKRAIYWNDVLASSGYSNQFGVIAYPNSQPVAIGISGFRNYRTKGQVISKFSVFASECDEGATGQPENCATNPANQTFGIQASAYGRIVANKISDREGGCADGTQAAIGGNVLSGDRVSGSQMLGNEIYEYGCIGSSKFHHTTYLSVRSGEKNIQVDPWRFGWNYLHDNHTKNGIHNYDENQTGLECGSPNGPVIINHNVVINQAGTGINIGANCPWTNDFEVYNNIVINAGLALDWDGLDPNTANGPSTAAITVQDGGLMGDMNIYNNIFHTWNDDDPAKDTQSCLGLQGSQDNTHIYWNNNVCNTDKDKPFVNSGYNGSQLLDNVSGGDNTWFYSGSNATQAIVPAWDATARTIDPLLTITGSMMEASVESPEYIESLLNGIYKNSLD